MSHKKNHKTQGQALLEFALILTVLLMMIFLIVESARILWAWNQVQNAAREGARYAITGQFSDPCDSAQLPKFAAICDSTDTKDMRVASIINIAHKGLSGLPLNEVSGIFEDDYYYQIEVWGVNSDGQMQAFYGGVPNTPVVVRAFYRVPIITPLLQPIIPSVPVFGQVTMNNETFGQLGNANQGQGVPPELPLFPTPGITPSPTYTPSPTATPTVGATPTNTPTFTPSPTATPDFCGLEFEGNPIADNNFVYVTGEIGHVVTIIDVTTGDTLGSDTLKDRTGHACPGFASFEAPNQLTQLLLEGHLLIAESDNSFDAFDTAWVLKGTPTPTPSPTNTTAPTPTATHTATPSPSPTPGQPYIELLPTCGTGPDVQFTVIGSNWPQNTTVSLYWDTNNLQSTLNTGGSNFFSQTWNKFGIADGSYDVVAVSASDTATATFSIPCPIPPTATPITATPTNTPAPADLLIVGPPVLVSTPPIVAYQPVDFSVTISNTGGIAVESQFFVDVFLDPTTVLTTSIPINQSGGYQGVSSLAGGESRVITFTAPLGFANTGVGSPPEQHVVYGMVDSLEQIVESDETNNISMALLYDQVTPAPTPTFTPTPIPGADSIIGIVYRPSEKGQSPLLRATVLLKDGATVVDSTTSDPLTGIYQFTNLPPSTYTVMACGSLSTSAGTVNYFGLRTGITLPYPFAVSVYTTKTTSCPAEFQ